MCLIVVQSRKDNPTNLEDWEIRKAFNQNGDGAGLMFDWEGELITEKPFMKVEDLIDAYRVAKEEYTNHLAVHWRWSTAGSHDHTNTHPHVICKGQVAFMHNGVLPFEKFTSFDISDTVYWARTVFHGRSMNHVMGRKFRNHMEQYIGQNKIALISKDGRLSLLNENKGEWWKGRWHSNGCLGGYSAAARPTTKSSYYDSEYPWSRTCDFVSPKKRTIKSVKMQGKCRRITYLYEDGGETTIVSSYNAEEPKDIREDCASVVNTDIDEVRYQAPYDSRTSQEWLRRRFDESGIIVGPNREDIRDDDGKYIWASDVVAMCEHDRDYDIHDYHGLILPSEVDLINTTIDFYSEAGAVV